MSPDGKLREWLRQNACVGAWLLIPALLIMPVVGLIPWQFTGWLTMLTFIVGRLIVLPFLILLAFAVIRFTVTFFKR